MLPAPYRLRKSKDFQRVYQEKNSLASRLLVVYMYNRNDDEPTRFGFSLSRKVGKAHVRNLYKRRLSEMVRLDIHLFKQGFDVIVLARKPIVDEDYHSLKVDFFNLLERIGIFEESN